MKTFYVYILASHARALYIGITNDLERRVYEHKNKAVPGFTAKYNVDRLVYFEDTTDAVSAITREKQLKGWTRAKKIALIESTNPRWDDMSDRWYAAGASTDDVSEQAMRSLPARQDPSRVRSG